ncbi:OmpA family protein [Novosphingobium aerophilum]|uniref:OmpA family protein n=1 Tax=Novosphingobium TaxID=165696 RepID=UPI0006C86C73|nr:MULTISPECIES: OmpA family protein [unclassified Novosphingobium]KPH64426.1 membrane protein [Novosphingobium sp. ST904]MPS70407.1 OmpA family protein [Novosphingobium sp.]TCM37441.1 OOP family OmpA-OmpF porin [Novosphingobium sp. ST904]WRT93604.1 OmpA family protein [Novosphingobium sp. RL4]
MNPRRASIVAAGAALCLALSFVATRVRGPIFIGNLERQAEIVRDRAGGSGVDLAFRDRYGWLTRHPVLSGGKGLDAETRTRVAAAVTEVPGIGGITWSSEGDGTGGTRLRCQDDVEAILASRTIRFTEASARIDPVSERLLDEVARALRPCVGSIIAVTGHTDATGNPQANKALSLARAESVRWALIGRGIPADGLRAAGLGSKTPIEGLDPLDPANRRIEFSVIASAPVKPTPIDTPGAE